MCLKIMADIEAHVLRDLVDGNTTLLKHVWKLNRDDCVVGRRTILVDRTHIFTRLKTCDSKLKDAFPSPHFFRSRLESHCVNGFRHFEHGATVDQCC